MQTHKHTYIVYIQIHLFVCMYILYMIHNYVYICMQLCFYLNISETAGQLWAPPEILFLGQGSGHELRVVNVAGSILGVDGWS